MTPEERARRIETYATGPQRLRDAVARTPAEALAVAAVTGRLLRPRGRLFTAPTPKRTPTCASATSHRRDQRHDHRLQPETFWGRNTSTTRTTPST